MFSIKNLSSCVLWKRGKDKSMDAFSPVTEIQDRIQTAQVKNVAQIEKNNNAWTLSLFVESQIEFTS